MARLGAARFGVAWQGRQGWVRCGGARWGVARQARQGEVRRGPVGRGKAGKVWHGKVRLGRARHGKATQAGKEYNLTRFFYSYLLHLWYTDTSLILPNFVQKARFGILEQHSTFFCRSGRTGATGFFRKPCYAFGFSEPRRGFFYVQIRG